MTSGNTPRIALAGLAIECSTFSPAMTTEEAFRVLTGDGLLAAYPCLAPGGGLRERAEWHPALYARALPGGVVAREAYEALVSRTLALLRTHLPYDGLFLDLHGAMSVAGLQDAEAEFLLRVREVVGYDTLVSLSMDLHGNVSRRLAEQVDLITCYRTAPHEDTEATERRALDNLLSRLERGQGKPRYKAWIPLPILLPGEKTSTRVEPARSLYAAVEPVASREGIMDASIWVGYAWADEPRSHAVVMVTGDDGAQVASAAEELARAFWAARGGFDFVAPSHSLEACLDRAFASDRRPFLISDTGDNPTAGGAGDVTWTLERLLQRPEVREEGAPSVIYASIPGPALVQEAVHRGLGGEVEAEVGAMVDHRFAPPCRLRGVVTAIRHGDPHALTEVVVQAGALRVIVTERRKPYHHLSDFGALGLDLRQAGIVIVKLGYLVPDLFAIQADWLMALTPGGVDQDLTRLGYQRVQRPLCPLDPDMAEPDLGARLIRVSGPQPSPSGSA